MAFLVGNDCFLIKSPHRCIEVHLQCSNGTLCLLIALEDTRRVRKPLKTPFMLAQLKTVMLVREAIKLAFLLKFEEQN